MLKEDYHVFGPIEHVYYSPSLSFWRACMLFHHFNHFTAVAFVIIVYGKKYFSASMRQVTLQFRVEPLHQNLLTDQHISWGLGMSLTTQPSRSISLPSVQW